MTISIFLAQFSIVLGLHWNRRCCRSNLPSRRNKLGFTSKYFTKIEFFKDYMVLCEKRAVSRVMPPDSQSFQPRSDPDVMVVDDYINVPSSPIETATDMMEVGNNVGHPPVPNNQTNDQPSTSTVRNNLTKMLKFTIQYCDRIITIELPESATVCELLRNNESQVFTKYFFTADLKLRLFKELKVSPCRQLLSGWARMSQYENTPFSALQLPQESSLHLTLKPSEGGFTAEDE
jgi:hypothetical protein